MSLLADSLTAERRFMLACARLNPDERTIAELAAGVRRWPAVVAEAERHHLAGLLSRACEPCSAVPAGVKEELREVRQRSAVLSSIYLRDAAAVLEAFGDAGLQPVVLKGVALAERLYGDVGLRAFCDLDALFAVPDLDRAEEVLRALRYRQEPSPHSRAWYFRHYYQLPRYVNPVTRFCVELHWDLGRRPYPFRFDIAAMRERAVPIEVCGVKALAFDNEDTLLHLIVHVAWGNGFDAHLRGFVDIAEVIRGGIDWPVFEQRVLDANAAQVAVPSLELAAWLFDAPVPAATLERLRLRCGGRLSRKFAAIGQARVLDGGAGHRTWMRLFWLERARDRATLLAQNFGTDGEVVQENHQPIGMRLLRGAMRAAQPFFSRGAE